MIVESYEDLIKLSGALRVNFWDTVHTAISLALKRSPEGVIIDCSNITECTINGADTFHDVMKFLKKNDARVIVAAVPPNIMEVLKQVPDVRSQLPIAATVEEARASLFRLTGNEDDYGKPKKKKIVATTERKLMVSLDGGPSDENLIQFACEHAQTLNASLVLVRPIIVPRELPLQAPLAEEEGEAGTSLNRASEYCEKLKIEAHAAIPRGRDTASALAEALEDNHADQLMVALPCQAGQEDEAAKLVKQILTKVRKPVMFVRGRN